jgi:hypothetical protein
MAKKEKILEYINDINIIFGDKKSSKAETESAIKRQDLREQKLADSPILRNNINRKKVVKKPIRPRPNIHLNNPLSNTATDNFLELVDPGGWADEKKVQVEENLFDKYLELLKGGELLPGTTFEMFEKNYHDFDTDLISRINKRIKRKKLAEGVAALMGEPRKIYYNDKSIRKIPKI